MQFTGAAVSVAQSVQAELNSNRACFSASETGLLAYHYGLNKAQLTWFDRHGNRFGTVGEPGLLRDVQLAPDGRRAAALVSDASGGATVWIYELDRNIRHRFSSVNAFNFTVVWSRDARRLVIGTRRDASYIVYATDADAMRGEELLFRSSFEVIPGSWSPNGGLTLIARNAKTGFDIDYLPPKDKGRDSVPVPVLHDEGDEMLTVVSPDGRWILYNHNEPGEIELYPYIASFPGGGQRRQIASDGAAAVRWNPNGKEVFYASHNKLMAADVRTSGDILEIGAPRMLFQMHVDCHDISGACLDVAPDGNRFLVADFEGSPPPVALIQNWTEGLKK
jgi:Tol biopolymer transport system component